MARDDKPHTAFSAMHRARSPQRASIKAQQRTGFGHGNRGAGRRMRQLSPCQRRSGHAYDFRRCRTAFAVLIFGIRWSDFRIPFNVGAGFRRRLPGARAGSGAIRALLPRRDAVRRPRLVPFLSLSSISAAPSRTRASRAASVGLFTQALAVPSSVPVIRPSSSARAIACLLRLDLCFTCGLAIPSPP
jgi:hypothetical protein